MSLYYSYRVTHGVGHFFNQHHQIPRIDIDISMLNRVVLKDYSSSLSAWPGRDLDGGSLAGNV